MLCEAGLGRPAAGSPGMLAACVAVVALAAALYSVYGGLRATTWAGVLQLAVVLAGGGLLVAVGSHELGGLAAVVKRTWPPIHPHEPLAAGRPDASAGRGW